LPVASEAVIADGLLDSPELLDTTGLSH
jgi:hypothetical protein